MVVEDEILEDVTIDELRESLSEHEPRWRSISHKRGSIDVISLNNIVNFKGRAFRVFEF